MPKYPKPKGQFYCPFCKQNITDKDIKWQGIVWVHAACWDAWKASKEARNA